MKLMDSLDEVVDFEHKPALALKDTSEDAKHLFIDFYADWCGPCKAMKSSLAEVESKYPDIDFIKVDVEKSPKVAEQFGVKSIPTFYIISKTGKVTRHSGALELAELSNLIESTVK